MTNPFKVRKPWAVFLVALLLHPYIGMLYIGRARLAGLYFLLLLGFLAAFFAIYPAGFGDLHCVDAEWLFELPLGLVGAAHATYLAWKHRPAIPVAWYGRWYTVLGIPAIWIALVFANQHLLFPLYYVPSKAMEPGIAQNSAVIGSRLAYHFREPARGDVIAFYDPRRKATFIKRIVGVPHDRVEMRGGFVILNGKPLSRTVISRTQYLWLEHIPGTGRSYSILKNEMGGPFDDVPEVTVPAGRYYVLGDNRDNSLDSRSNDAGFAARENITGRVTVKSFDGDDNRFVIQSVR